VVVVELVVLTAAFIAEALTPPKFCCMSQFHYGTRQGHKYT